MTAMMMRRMRMRTRKRKRTMTGQMVMKQRRMISWMTNMRLTVQTMKMTRRKLVTMVQ